jgi:uncharacterized protein (DUF1800 family)
MHVVRAHLEQHVASALHNKLTELADALAQCTYAEIRDDANRKRAQLAESVMRRQDVWCVRVHIAAPYTTHSDLREMLRPAIVERVRMNRYRQLEMAGKWRFAKFTRGVEKVVREKGVLQHTLI